VTHPIIDGVRLHGTLVRFFYRVFAPNSARGFLDMHAVYEGDPGRTLWIHSHGMSRFNLPDIELVGVPADLRGPAHGLMMSVLDYMKNQKPILPDENFGGLLIGEEQLAPHLATIRRAPDRDDDHRSMLRLVDFEEPADSGFPHRLFATHLCALATISGRSKREHLYRRATEIFSGAFADKGEGVDAGTGEVDAVLLQRKTNSLAWESLAMDLTERGAFDEAIAAFDQAVARNPAWASFFKKEVTEHAGTNFPPAEHPITAYWIDVDIDAVRARVRS